MKFWQKRKKLQCPAWERNPGHQQTQLMLYHWATETIKRHHRITSQFVWNFRPCAMHNGDCDGFPDRIGLVCGHWMVPMLCNGGRADKKFQTLAGDVACLGGSVVEHQRFPAGAFVIFSVSAKASSPISLSPFPSSSFPFPSPFHLLLALCFEISFRNKKVMALQNLVSQRFRDWAVSFVGTRPWAARPCFYGHSKHQSMVRDDTRTKQASELQKNELRSCCTSQAWTHLSCWAWNTTHRTFGRISFAFEELLRWGFRDQICNDETFLIQES